MKKLNHHLLNRGGYWYYRRLTPTLRQPVALGVQDVAEARRLRDHYDRVLESERARARAGLPPACTDETLLAKLGLLNRRRDLPTLGTLFEAWAKYAAIQRLSPRVVRNVPTCLRRMLKGAGEASSDDTLLDVVTAEASARYEDGMKLAASARGPLAYNRTLNTIGSVLRTARQLFSPGALASTPYRGLKMPTGVANFMARPIPAGEIIPEKDLSTQVEARLRRGRQLMRRFAPRHWLVLVLGEDIGLRRGEIMHARWDWFEEVTSRRTGRTFIQVSVVISADFAPKGRSRVFELSPESEAVWRREVLPARLSPCDEIIPAELGAKARGRVVAHPEERAKLLALARDKVSKRMAAWLRTIGAVRDLKEKPLHKLRKLHATATADRYGLDAAQEHMGHSSSRTTKEHYVLGR